ncbi:MAG TPA: response regulator, partial [Arachidicoccus soli]|nr:response regulator [Arachidicoccus soli]
MNTKSKKVLIADDEEDILEIIGYNLRKENYEVFTAKDGKAAIEKAKESKPDLIILDMMMPFYNGMEVCEILRSLPQFEET